MREGEAAFPCGLIRPEGAYGGGEDALWLAAFAGAGTRAAKGSLIDIGTGCGTVALACLLREEAMSAWTGVGLDMDAELVAAATENARRLGLDERFRADVADVTRQENLVLWRRQATGKRGFDLVLANPPWRLEDQGRLPPSPARRRALFGTRTTLPAFAAAAAFLLRPGGRYACIVGASRLADACTALHTASLTPRRLRCIHPEPGAPAILALLEAVREHGGGSAREGILDVETPIFVRTA